MTTLTVGRQLGRFRVVAPLGRGGMAAVYRAEEAGLGREVALKVLPAELMEQPGFLERFEREAQVIAQLEHPNIVPLYASGVDEGVPWMALRLLTHGTLQERLEAGGLETDEGLQLFAQIARALDHAHAQGVLHRDLKPQNVLLGADGSAYLADFGIARILSGSSALTGTGTVLGTPPYMAPEQAKGETLGPPCDRYALAVMLYRWLCGEVPFDADTPLAVLMKQVQAEVPLEPMQALPPAAREVLLKGLDKDPAQRWPSSLAMLQALDAALRPGATSVAHLTTGSTAGSAPGAGARGSAGKLQAPAVGRRGLGLVALIALGALLVAGTLQVWPPERTSVEAPEQSKRERSTQIATDRRADTGVEEAAPAEPPSPAALSTASDSATDAGTPPAAAEQDDSPDGVSAARPPPPAAPPAASPSGADPQPRSTQPAPARPAASSGPALARQNPEPPASDPPPAASARAADERAVISEIQAELRRLGRELQATGELDAATQAAIRAFSEAAGGQLEGHPPAAVLAALKAAAQWPTPAPGSVFRDCPQCPELVVIPAGRFLMGSPSDEPQRMGYEGPQHEVRVQSFAMARFETRFAEWDACLAAGGCRQRPADNGWGGGEQPVINVSWEDIQDYLAWMSERTGERYRLPSEAEWEYAARAGTRGRHYLGDCFSSESANFNAAMPAQGCSAGEFRQRSVAVGSFAPNPFGLYDMHGNVWEWMQDCANDDYRGAPEDGSAWLRGDCRKAIVRGGGWHDWGFWLRAAARYSFPRDSRHPYGGFRVVRELQ